MKRVIHFSKTICVLTLLFYSQKINSQTPLSIKEEFDYFNTKVADNYRNCLKNCAANLKSGSIGNGSARVMEAYITMYKTTGDKAYLYKFIIESLEVMNFRGDYAGVNTEPRWSVNISEDGQMLATLSRFVFFIKKEDPILLSESIFQFPDIVKYSNSLGQTFNTFSDYANWLESRVDETLNWYNTMGFWTPNYGYKKFPTDKDNFALEINQVVGMARALLFNGLTSNNSSYMSKALVIADLFKRPYYIADLCENIAGPFYVFNITSNNAYYWFHNGYSFPKHDCPVIVLGIDTGTKLETDDWIAYKKYKEDISHATLEVSVVRDFLAFQPNTPFSNDDMVRFRNMFALNVYDGNGGFHEAVDGTDGPVFPQYQLDISALSYMSLEKYDGYDNTATGPNVYDIVMEYYKNNVSNTTSLINNYGGLANLGHAEIVQSQWEREKVNLTLYNRDVVYDQDFFAKNLLTIDPSQSLSGVSFAEPLTLRKEFVVESGVSVNLRAGNDIILKPGVIIKNGANFQTHIVPLNNLRAVSGSSSSSKSVTTSRNSNIIDTTNYTAKENLKSENIITSVNVYPNPFGKATVLKLSLSNASVISISIFDNFGRIVYDEIKEKNFNSGTYNIPIPVERFNSGIYHCVLNIDNKQLITTKLIKEN